MYLIFVKAYVVSESWEGWDTPYSIFLYWSRCWSLLIWVFRRFFFLLSGVVFFWLIDMVVGRLCVETESVRGGGGGTIPEKV